jgi:glutathione synthase/RimK-type ligase-like ATP-grasp enzyme
MRILVSDGSGLRSRQVATVLVESGREVEVLSSTRLCLTSFTRRVRKVHLVPPFATAPLAWFDAARAIAHAREVDVLLPTQEQVTVLSALRPALGVLTVVPPFESLRRIQDKISACRTLLEIGIRQPASCVIAKSEDLGRISEFPVYVKRPISTASMGVRKVCSRGELDAAAVHR